MSMDIISAKFSMGELVHHRLFDYRGVIIDVDPEFMGDDEWYDVMATSCPSKEQPWYRVLVHNAVHETYVAEGNLQIDMTKAPVDHPEIDLYFDGFEDGAYQPVKDDFN